MRGGVGLAGLLARSGFDSRSEEALRMQAYLVLLEKWNAHINLTASTEWTALRRFFEEALWAGLAYPAEARRHLDLGSGGGFPAIPMRIVRPHMRLTLVESRSRKAAFLETVAAELRLERTEVCCCRIEELPSPAAGEKPYDIVSWKGIRLSRGDLRKVLGRVDSGSEFWIFHGTELPFEDCRTAESLALVRREACPGSQGRFLSVFRALARCFT